jgi:transposase-like protein
MKIGGPVITAGATKIIASGGSAYDDAIGSGGTLLDDAAAARNQWRDVADQMRPRLTKFAGLLDETETDVLAYMDFPAPHRTKIHSTNLLARLNGQIKCRANVVGILPNEAAVVRLIGALSLEQNNEWATQRARYMKLETIATMSNTAFVKMPKLAA